MTINARSLVDAIVEMGWFAATPITDELRLQEAEQILQLADQRVMDDDAAVAAIREALPVRLGLLGIRDFLGALERQGFTVVPGYFGAPLAKDPHAGP